MPIFTPTAVVITWPCSRRGVCCWRTANVAASAGPSASPPSAISAIAAGSECASGHVSMIRPSVPIATHHDPLGREPPLEAGECHGADRRPGRERRPE